MTDNPAAPLLPCPFCGSAALFTPDDSYDGCSVTCSNCEAAPDGAYQHKTNAHLAVAAWNTRPAPPAQAAQDADALIQNLVRQAVRVGRERQKQTHPAMAGLANMDDENGLRQADAALRAHIAALKQRAEKAEEWNRQMVAKAAEKNNLEGYRELARKLADAEAERDAALARAVPDGWVVVPRDTLTRLLETGCELLNLGDERPRADDGGVEVMMLEAPQWAFEKHGDMVDAMYSECPFLAAAQKGAPRG